MKSVFNGFVVVCLVIVIWLLSSINNGIHHIKGQLEASSIEKSALIETLTSNQKLLEHTRQKKKKKKFLGVF